MENNDENVHPDIKKLMEQSMEFLNEGPSEVVIPEQRYMSCRRCKWYKTTLWKSGREPEYRQQCCHHTWTDTTTIWGKINGGKREIETSIREYSVVPEWCPVTSIAAGEDITKII